MQVGDLVRFKNQNGNPHAKHVFGLILPPTKGMSRFWTNTSEADMVNILWTDIGVSPYRKDYLEVVIHEGR